MEGRVHRCHGGHPAPPGSRGRRRPERRKGGRPRNRGSRRRAEGCLRRGGHLHRANRRGRGQPRNPCPRSCLHRRRPWVGSAASFCLMVVAPSERSAALAPPELPPATTAGPHTSPPWPSGAICAPLASGSMGGEMLLRKASAPSAQCIPRSPSLAGGPAPSRSRCPLNFWAAPPRQPSRPLRNGRARWAPGMCVGKKHDELARLSGDAPRGIPA